MFHDFHVGCDDMDLKKGRAPCDCNIYRQIFDLQHPLLFVSLLYFPLLSKCLS